MQCNKPLHNGVVNIKLLLTLSTWYVTIVPTALAIIFFFFFSFSYAFQFSYIASLTVITEDTDRFGRWQVVDEKAWKEIGLHLDTPKRKSVKEQWMLKRSSAHRRAEFNKSERSLAYVYSSIA